MIAQKNRVHFTASQLLAPTNPILVNLIGAGGTGSQVLTALARMNHALTALGHAGLSVKLWDDDTVTEANLARQLFAQSEIGLFKSVALINRINRFFGTYWKAQTVRFCKSASGRPPKEASAEITISCVDTVAARFDIAGILTDVTTRKYQHNTPLYWLDFGNSQHIGQVVLCTIGSIEQPHSKKFEPVANLPLVTEEFGELMRSSETGDDTPSCSLADALEKQDLFINSALAQMGCAILWQMLREGVVENRGLFLNLKLLRTQPIKIE